MPATPEVCGATDSNHQRPVYPNLAAELMLTGLNQLWVADITYIRLEREFVYLAVVIDAFSRRVIGWALDLLLRLESVGPKSRLRRPEGQDDSAAMEGPPLCRSLQAL